MAATFTQDDFRRIRLSLAAALLMIATGAAAVYASIQMKQAEEKNNKAALAKRGESQRRLNLARDEELEIKQKIARFNELSARGIFGEEQRLDWVEQIRQIKQARKLFDIQYEIAPQQLADAVTVPGRSANFEYLASPMQVQMKLLHEDDLLNFLADLRSTAKAYLRVRKCDVSRLPRVPSERGSVAPQLSADCTIDWITIRERKGA
ncbi:MAG: hypothetical protein HZC23_08790 [Rhodocyclales bacterium]|nr:hypothetical protein [Rhodocyclales bacterium]